MGTSTCASRKSPPQLDLWLVLAWRTRTNFHSHTMDIRPNSHPERTGPYLTGMLSDDTLLDSATVGAALSRDIGPDTDSDIYAQRLITRRTQHLKDARENLKDFRTWGQMFLLSLFYWTS